MFEKSQNSISADEIISESDRQKMVANYMFFSRMTSTTEVIQRLVSRRVISEKQKEKLVRLQHTEGTEKVMENNLSLTRSYSQYLKAITDSFMQEIKNYV